MTNYERIASKINRELELQQRYKTKADESARRVIELRKSLVDSYPKFISDSIKESPNKFVYKEKFPTTEEIRSFYQYGNTNNISLYEYGWFDIKELAAIIKTLYSLKRQQEYKIITLTNFEIEYNGPEKYDKHLVPYMNFLIGIDKKIEYLNDYNGNYFESNSLLNSDVNSIFEAERHQNIVRLKQKSEKNNTSLGIRFENDKNWILDELCYFDDISLFTKYAKFSSKYNIFDKYFGEVKRRLDNEPRKNIGALLSFSLDFQDNFIAKTLMSIVIYKKKINKLELDNNDYKYIFYELFKSDIDISKIVDKEIPKVLTKHQ